MLIHALLMSLALMVVGQDAPPAPDAEPPAPAEVEAPVDPKEAARKEREELEGMLESGDTRSLSRWFTQNRDKALPFIDSYLEGGLAMIEKGEDEAEAQASFEKGVAFARVASQGLREPAYHKYASAFASWTPEQRVSFREGQKLFGAGRKALAEGDAEKSLELHQESFAKARPLGDLWGMAMAQGGMGSANAALGKHEEALRAFDQAVALNAKLGLRMSELMTRVAQSKSYRAMSRSRAAAGTMMEAERKLNDDDPKPVVVAVLMELAEAYDAMGQPEHAERYRNRIPRDEEDDEADDDDEDGDDDNGGDDDGDEADDD